MTSFDSSSSEAESGMDDHSNKTNTLREEEEETPNDGAPEVDMEVWESFSSGFRHVQSILDQNRLLIQQVNVNHQSKLPHNLTKNVSLIREINSNISKVVSLYSDLSSNFSTAFHQRRGNVKSKGESG
ncbi:hypothetical protein GIB67_027496 [Kingdonia uniflora]|uniref:Protein EARLY FLOWERING 4 domain-containing protein n=1 Tax=Kingdonia uniflora TaxID=39325 RepID=A0A7J7MFC9_9MAGN|nr:hypothetical protein GIB67_027496 [Kingdonia uniflora]